MKLPLLSKAVNIGTPYAGSDKEKGIIILTNEISWLLGSLPLIYIVFNVYDQGWERITMPIIIQPFLFLLPVLFNAIGYTTVSRIAACWSMPVLAMIFSIYNKTEGLDLQTSHYMGIRFSILASSVIPFLVFPLKKKVLLFISLFPAFLTLIAFDVIHDWAGVGYYASGLNESGYSLTNMRVMIAFLLIVGASLFLKRLVEKNESLNLELIYELTEKNQEIQTQLEENSAQHEQILFQKEKLEKQFTEIATHRDHLHQNEKKLSHALETIKTQQEVLVNQNKSLEFEVVSKNKELLENNQQLIQYNNELQQFSYTVSHNLRGPVATIMGLIHIIDQENAGSSSPVYGHLKKAMHQLDETIRDLNRILDIRNQVAQIRQAVDIREVTEKVKATFQKEINEFQILVLEEYAHMSDPISIRSLIFSIIYNLMSNAIKYRSSERRPEIHIKCREEENQFVISVRDNGIGLDTEAHREKLFQLYRRFNVHTRQGHWPLPGETAKRNVGRNCGCRERD